MQNEIFFVCAHHSPPYEKLALRKSNKFRFFLFSLFSLKLMSHFELILVCLCAVSLNFFVVFNAVTHRHGISIKANRESIDFDGEKKKEINFTQLSREEPPKKSTRRSLFLALSLSLSLYRYRSDIYQKCSLV